MEKEITQEIKRAVKSQCKRKKYTDISQTKILRRRGLDVISRYTGTMAGLNHLHAHWTVFKILWPQRETSTQSIHQLKKSSQKRPNDRLKHTNNKLLVSLLRGA